MIRSPGRECARRVGGLAPGASRCSVRPPAGAQELLARRRFQREEDKRIDGRRPRLDHFHELRRQSVHQFPVAQGPDFLHQLRDGIRVARIQRDGRSEAADRLTEPAEPPQGAPQIAIGLRISRRQAEGLPVTAHRVFQESRYLAGIAEVVVRFRICGLDCDRLPVLCDGLRGAPLLHQEVAEIVESRGETRSGRHGLLEEPNRRDAVALAAGGNSENVERRRVPWIGCENPAANRARVVPTSALRQVFRQSKGFPNGQSARHQPSIPQPAFDFGWVGVAGGRRLELRTFCL